MRFHNPVRACICVLVLLIGSFSGPAFSQESKAPAAGAPGARVAPILSALEDMLADHGEQDAALEALKRQLDAASDGDKARLSEALSEAQQARDKSAARFDTLATGGAADKYRRAEDTEIDLQKEFENLLQPFVVMLKMATEDSRQLELLRHQRFKTANRREIARQASEHLQGLIAQARAEPVTQTLNTALDTWQEREKSAGDLIISLDQQIDALLNKRAEGAGVSSAFGGFLRDRIVSLVLGLAAFAIVLGGLLFPRSLFARLFVQRNRTARGIFRIRLLGLIYLACAVIASVGAMLYVFNARNDWLLLGLGILFVIAAIWILMKMLPDLIGKVTLLLNLGAVQEDERVVFNGVPWRVKRLAFYTDLVNPLLSAGTLTLPVGDLVGLHSRPVAENEEWFPCRVGQWVRLSDENIGEVIFQSPEMVQIKLLGGAIVTYPTPDFLSLNPTNLSHDYRVEVEFGIDYTHQAISTTRVPQIFRDALRKGLPQIVDEKDILSINVDLLRAGASSIDYEVEADIRGSAARLNEDIERLMTKLLIEACNEHELIIPFPQLTVHGATA